MCVRGCSWCDHPYGCSSHLERPRSENEVGYFVLVGTGQSQQSRLEKPCSEPHEHTISMPVFVPGIDTSRSLARVAGCTWAVLFSAASVITVPISVCSNQSRKSKLIISSRTVTAVRSPKNQKGGAISWKYRVNWYPSPGPPSM